MKKSILALSFSMVMAAGSLFAQGNLLGNGELNKGSWNNWNDQKYLKDGAKVSFTDGKFSAEIPAMEKKNIFAIQLIKAVELEEGKTYECTFTATADKEGTIRVTYLLSKAPWTAYCATDVKITAGTNEYKCKITPKKDKDGKYEKPQTFRLFLGNMVGNVTLEKISLTEAQ